MSAAERNFRDFQFGDNVSELAGGMLPALAERAGMQLEGDLTVDQLGQLVGVFGKNRGLRDAADADFLTTEEMVTYAQQARADCSPKSDGSEHPISRSLTDPNRTVPEGTRRVMTGMVANWYDFASDYLVGLTDELTHNVTVDLPTGRREMKLPTELTNQNHMAFRVRHKGQNPTEQQYRDEFVIPKLEIAGYEVEPMDIDSENGDEIAQIFVSRRPELFTSDQGLSFVRTSISALQLLLQMRKAAREAEAGTVPELFMEASARQIATTKAEIDQPLQFQAPQPALRQAALDGKLLLIEQQQLKKLIS